MKNSHRRKSALNRKDADGNGAVAPKSPARRAFLGKMGAAATVGAAALAAPAAAAAAEQATSSGRGQSPAAPSSVNNARVVQAFELRVQEATQDALVPAAK